MEEDEPICSGMGWHPTTHMFHKASHTMGPCGRGTNVQGTEGEQPNGSMTPILRTRIITHQKDLERS